MAVMIGKIRQQHLRESELAVLDTGSINVNVKILSNGINLR